MTQASLLLEVDRLTVRFGGLVAFSQVNFAPHLGGMVVFIGPNGAGKTSLFKS